MKNLTVCRASAGTGKTYTLAARYIALLMGSESDFLYRNILAVTFTNKATAEMKQRIISYLYVIAEGDGADNERSGFIEKMKHYMDGKSMTDTELREKASRVYHHILDDYENMKVTTIDSFLQSLVNGMAHHIGIGAGFGVVLDSKHLIADAVDEVMTSYVLENKQAEDLLTRYVEELLDEEKKWDVRDNLISMGMEMLRESVQQDDENIVTDPNIIRDYRKRLMAVYASAKAEMESEYNKVKDCETDEEIDKGSHYYTFITRVSESLTGKPDSSKLYKGLTENQVKSLSDSKFLKKIKDSARAVEIQSALLKMTDLCGKIYTCLIVVQYLNDLTMMGFVKGRTDNILNETNSVLLARTAYLLARTLQPGDADFILEKSGIRYSHIMIDEFQDTSSLQWNIFERLVSEVLSAGGTTLIVGDVKQSIYRWRNGDYTIMEGLGSKPSEIKDYFDENAERLTRNFRSQSNVVKFNLGLFKRIIAEGAYAHEFENIYKEGKEGYEEKNLGEFHKYGTEEHGYVQFRAYPVYKGTQYSNKLTEAQNSIKPKIVQPALVDGMFEDIEHLIAKGESPSDIMILIRKNKESAEIIAGYNRSGLGEKGISICSNDSFLLETSMAVLTIINCLKVIVKSDSIAREFLYVNGVKITAEDSKEIVEINGVKKDLREVCNIKKPLYELVESIVGEVLSDTAGMLKSSETAYLNCFMDSVRNYVETYGSDAKAFLTYWDDELHKKAIPASGAAGIRIMTIHSSKGLECKHLFIPFCDWPLEDVRGNIWVDAPKLDGIEPEKQLRSIPVQLSSRMNDCGYGSEYKDEQTASRVDNLNLLYVALTRAADSLYVYTMVGNGITEKDSKTSSAGDLIFKSLGGESVASGKTLVEEFKDRFASCELDTPVYAQYTLGAVDDIQKKKEKGAKSLSPFEYKYSDDEVVQCDTYVTNENISFRQSQESVLYTQGAAECTETAQKRIDAGVLRHNIFSEISTMADTDRIIDKYYTKGLIETAEDVRVIKEEFDAAWRNPQMADWFSGNWQLLREIAIIRPQSEYNADVDKWKSLPIAERGQSPQRELRPDRVMIKGKKAVVLDFKFGKQNHDKYSRQVKRYIELLKKMGYTDVEGYLWYGFDNEVIPV